MKNAYSIYKTANIETADQGKLILIAYDVAIQNCRHALALFEQSKMVEQRTRHLFKAQDALTELMSSLRMDVGEIAANLYKLYEYMLWKIVQAMVKNESSHIGEIIRMLSELKDAWIIAIKNVKSDQQDIAVEKTQKTVSVSV